MWNGISNAGSLSWPDLPATSMEELCADIHLRCEEGWRLVNLSGWPENGELNLLALLAGDADHRLQAARARCRPGDAYPSLTARQPSAHVFERELAEKFGLRPDGHPWLKPVRYPFDRYDRSRTMSDYPFFRMDGESVHEVAVGPVHAGVIEPGHFRFQCTGEDVHHLEIQLGYQHRGVEALLERAGSPAHPFRHVLAGSIAGDTVIGHTLAYCLVMEALTGTRIPRRALYIREIALELERMAIHCGDLAAIANDVAYLTGFAIFSAIRTRLINTSLAICGSRFGRSWLRTGGVRYGLDPENLRLIEQNLNGVMESIELAGADLFGSATVLSRLEKTGIVYRSTASRIGLTGMAARACGVPRDIRASHPEGVFAGPPLEVITLDSGDVYARTWLRFLELRQSAAIIRHRLLNLPDGPVMQTIAGPLAPWRMALGLVEGWRGEILHLAVTGTDGQPVHYRVLDPSLHNWTGLALAVRNNGISDFPLCNKSFNLSYCGHDL